MNHSVSKHTLFTYLAGQANPLERQTMEAWLKNPANTETFHEWLLEWEMRSLQFQPDQEAAFEKIAERLEQTDLHDADEVAMAERKPLFGRWGWRPYLVAATVLVALLIPLRNKILYQTYVTAYEETKTLTLDDGTGVALKSNSSLQVPRFGFYTAVREVLLTGEARFSVTHQPDHQRFVVKTSDQFQIEVLGTEFTVYARKQTTNVALDRGKIRVDYSQGSEKRQLLMKPGDLLTLTRHGNLHLHQLAPVATSATRGKHSLTFKETSVWEVCYLLREKFGLKVEIVDDSLAQRTISGNYSARNAGELLEILTESLDLKTEPTGTGLLLKNN
ncbi:FecR family protein [Larkinella knui]|uniref:Iron dicitrate transport regulator FecR n=1 Tax=Larkinella knui TaxID=2025310 RepID=A0A3P1CQY6_9BACT|nr:FecR domain-containing protein [Larkinella knui]RRB15496.1 iron dicitrate transport regulator FecR [Larkinella knui]